MIKALIQVVFTSHHPDTEMRLSCYSTPLPAPQEKTRETAAALSSYGVIIIIGDYVYSHQFNEMVKSRYATLASITPVEAISPPFCFSYYSIKLFSEKSNSH